ncbi:hypothetical protein BJV78DRAFT_1151637 [Lactifluus subvellereus]|nr:hypothetical protein BJV78DRAFT_1151637 [Lactifluus subvellereus]
MNYQWCLSDFRKPNSGNQRCTALGRLPLSLQGPHPASFLCSQPTFCPLRYFCGLFCRGPHPRGYTRDVVNATGVTEFIVEVSGGWLRAVAVPEWVDGTTIKSSSASLHEPSSDDLRADVLSSSRWVFGCLRREGPEVPDVTYRQVVETSALVFQRANVP